MSITIDTVGACLRYGYIVTGRCCGETKPVDLLAIALARGEAYPLAKVWRLVRCSCGRRPSLQLTPEWNPVTGHQVTR